MALASCNLCHDVHEVYSHFGLLTVPAEDVLIAALISESIDRNTNFSWPSELTSWNTPPDRRCPVWTCLRRKWGCRIIRPAGSSAFITARTIDLEFPTIRLQQYKLCRDITYRGITWPSFASKCLTVLGPLRRRGSAAIF